MKSNLVRNKSYAFALLTIGLARWLKQQKEFEIAGQILRSGTTVGSNVEEALAGISRADFIAKMSIASKEAQKPTTGSVCRVIAKLWMTQEFRLWKMKTWS